MNVLFVCTANQCRSPIAAALLSLRLAPDAQITVRSAGLLPGGRPAPAEAITRMGRFGVDLSGHRSRQISSELLADADLVLGMTRRHARTLIADRPDLRGATFTLKDMVRRGDALVPAASWLQVLRELAETRPAEALLGRSDADDISDPMGRPAWVWNRVVGQLDELTHQLAALLGQIPPPLPGPAPAPPTQDPR